MQNPCQSKNSGQTWGLGRMKNGNLLDFGALRTALVRTSKSPDLLLEKKPPQPEAAAALCLSGNRFF